MKQLREATVDALQQVQQLVEASEGTLYNQPSMHSESGIGRHVRHILDHFLALQQGLDKGSIDYNTRHRDSDIENNPSLALQLIQQLSNWFLHPQSAIDERAIKVESEISLKQQQTMQFDSSLSRELCYLINHTVHHVAYAKLVAKELGLLVDENMGIAPSTASYLRQQGS
ncbi:DinB family protein [Agarivorans sp. 1_MG-2023]|uniref:DinB family protein n=1 Tax=Agarivorans sp. 1_MG-2023 TaxID=3062634 RepID=UPI0026E35FE3|nr:DinB family protein [Agarivorans sp. 1_MG-2023]MDO6763229.1 DinB family protein [Agarivorans sp. 1_MG-2023]